MTVVHLKPPSRRALGTPGAEPSLEIEFSERPLPFQTCGGDGIPVALICQVFSGGLWCGFPELGPGSGLLLLPKGAPQGSPSARGSGRAPSLCAAGAPPGSARAGLRRTGVPRPSPYRICSLIGNQERRPRHDLIINGADPARRASPPPSPGEGAAGLLACNQSWGKPRGGGGGGRCAGEVRGAGPSGE